MGLFIAIRDIAAGMGAYRLHRFAELAKGTVIENDIRLERLGSPPMMASISGRSYRAARTTDSGLPPTPTQALSDPVSERKRVSW